MDVRDAVATRYSCRAFLPTPIPEATVRDIVERAARAPVGLFFALDKSSGWAQWADIGGLLQTVNLLARDYGLHTCPQQAWVSWHRTVRGFLGLPDNLMVYSGMALGYADASAPINNWRSPRAPLEEFASFEGFPN